MASNGGKQVMPCLSSPVRTLSDLSLIPPRCTAGQGQGEPMRGLCSSFTEKWRGCTCFLNVKHLTPCNNRQGASACFSCRPSYLN